MGPLWENKNYGTTNGPHWGQFWVWDHLLDRLWGRYGTTMGRLWVCGTIGSPTGPLWDCGHMGPICSCGTTGPLLDNIGTLVCPVWDHLWDHIVTIRRRGQYRTARRWGQYGTIMGQRGRCGIMGRPEGADANMGPLWAMAILVALLANGASLSLREHCGTTGPVWN